jgi:type 1 glutamine amidotransferase
MKKALLIGEYTQVKYHPLAGVDREITALLKDSFTVDIMEDYDKLDGKKLDQYDLLISYVDTGRCEDKLHPEFSAAVIPFLCRGGGLFAIHNGIFLHARHELAVALGGRLTKHPPYVTGMAIDIYASSHPIVQGLGNFIINDEPYTFELDAFTDRQILLEYHFGNGVFPAAWCHGYGKGRVVYTSLGHEETSFQQKTYREFLRRSALWAVGAAV